MACGLNVTFCAFLSGGFQMRAGPGLQAFPAGLQAVLGGTKPKQNILFERFSAVYTKKVSKARNINHIQLNHRSPAIAVFYPLTRPRLMQADAGRCRLFKSHAGRLLIQNNVYMYLYQF
jgi:hypothetical protein